jgi:phosphohistidine phosphatase SixA
MTESLHKEYAKLRRRPFLMPLGFPVAGVLLLLVIAGWLVMSASTTTIFVMRHAETAPDGPDAGLSLAGELRAEQLAEVFASQKGDLALDGVVVSSLRRTQDTARPLANALGIPVVVVESGEPRAMARRAIDEFHAGRVLVIGHSNTVPEIVLELSGREVPPMSESDYGTVYVVARPQFSRKSVTLLRLP